MPPSEKKLIAEIKSEIERTYLSDDRELLTVRYIRENVERHLKLENGFFSSPEWKGKSKELIKGYAVRSPPCHWKRMGG